MTNSLRIYELIDLVKFISSSLDINVSSNISLMRDYALFYNIPRKTGIYIISKKGDWWTDIQYIGHSENLQRRIYSHRLKHIIEILDVCLIDNRLDANFLEEFLIYILKPKLNRRTLCLENIARIRFNRYHVDKLEILIEKCSYMIERYDIEEYTNNFYSGC